MQVGPTQSLPSGSGPVFTPEAHRLDLGRTVAIALVVGIVLTGPLAWACVGAVVTDPDPVAKWIAGFFGLLFGGLCLLFVGSFWQATRPRGIVVDATGIWFWHGTAWDVIRWTQAARVGLSYELPPELPTIGGPVDHLKAAVSGWLKGRIYGALRVTDKRGTALEIVPIREQDLRELRRLRRYLAKDPAPAPDGPTLLWRVRLPAAYHSFEKLVAAGERFGRPAWEGWFRRQWSGGAGRGARAAG